MDLISSMAALLCVAAPQSDQQAPAASQFAEPIRLTADSKPLGLELRYPSPRLYDIDADGQAELVVADLTGRVRVAEKVAGDDLKAWGPLEPFMSGKRALKFHNW